MFLGLLDPDPLDRDPDPDPLVNGTDPDPLVNDENSRIRIH
jgi:hypothetical protein